jgi:hypothetical protein
MSEEKTKSYTFEMPVYEAKKEIDSNPSRWHLLWAVPFIAIIAVLGSLTALTLYLGVMVLVSLLGAMLVALPVWLIWGAIFPALMGYWEWVGIIVVIRLIFSPIFTRGINKYLTNKYQK